MACLQSGWPIEVPSMHFISNPNRSDWRKRFAFCNDVWRSAVFLVYDGGVLNFCIRRQKKMPFVTGALNDDSSGEYFMITLPWMGVNDSVNAVYTFHIPGLIGTKKRRWDAHETMKPYSHVLDLTLRHYCIPLTLSKLRIFGSTPLKVKISAFNTQFQWTIDLVKQ